MADGPVESPTEWAAYFRRGGHGYLATADREGRVDAAPYARPHVQSDGRWAFGMTEGRTLQNLLENPHALYLFHEGSYLGVRVALELVEVLREGELVESIRDSVYRLLGRGAGDAVAAAVFFRPGEVRPLAGRRL